MHAADSLGLNKLNDGIGMICRSFLFFIPWVLDPSQVDFNASHPCHFCLCSIITLCKYLLWS